MTQPETDVKTDESSTKDEGFVLFHRKIRHDWKWTNPLYRAAWTWLLLHAEWRDFNGLKRGQVRFAVSQAPKLWGMCKMTASRFLKKCVEDGSITWEKGHPGPKRKATAYLSHDTNRVTNRVTNTGLITICNYDRYQDLSRWAVTNRVTKRVTSSIASPIASSKRTSPSAPERLKDAPTAKVSRKGKPEASHDPKVIKMQIDQIDLNPFREKYEPLGVDVDMAFDGFSSVALAGTGKAGQDYANPYNWTNFPLAFHNWCRNRAERQRERKATHNPTDELTDYTGITREELFARMEEEVNAQTGSQTKRI